MLSGVEKFHCVEHIILMSKGKRERLRDREREREMNAEEHS